MEKNIYKINGEERIIEFNKWLINIPEKIRDKLWLIPIIENKKEPDVPKGESWLDEKFRLSIEEAENRLRNGKNVGFVAENSSLVVFDIDLYKIENEEIKNEILNIFPSETLTVQTPRGGIHRYYVPENEIKNADGKGKYKNCGEIRANKKYVLVPGSVVNGNMYRVIKEVPPIPLSSSKIPVEFKPSIEELKIEEKIERGMLEEFKNKYGWSLSDIILHDSKLWVLLFKLHPPEYPSISEADMATITKLRFWEFDKETIFNIIRTCRKREKVLKRDDYLEMTYLKSIPQHVISDLVDVNKWNPRFDNIEQSIIEKSTSLKDPELDLSVLPEDSFIRKYIETMNKFTDAYPEYHLSSSFSILSIVLRRNVEIYVKPRIIYPNLWFLNLGVSTISRKTTALNLAKEILEWANLDKYMIPDDFSPEALISTMKDIPQCIFIKDEITDFFSKIKKSYGIGMDSIFCALYSSPSKYERRLRKEKITINEPYLVLLGDTVPSSLLKYLSGEDIDTGFIPRFLILMPEREKETKPIESLNPEEENEKIKLAEWVSKLNKNIENYVRISEKKVKVFFENEALELFNEWRKEKEKELYSMEDVEKDRWGAILGRLFENTIKIATIIRFSRKETLEFFENTNPFEEKIIFVNSEDMKIAIDIIENIFMKYALKFMIFVESNIESNIVEKVATIIKKAGAIEKYIALKRSRLRSREFNEALETLVERNDIFIKEEKTTGRPKLMIYWIGG